MKAGWLMVEIRWSYPVVKGDEIRLVDVLGGDLLCPLKLLTALQFADGKLYVYCRVQIVFKRKRPRRFNHVTDECKEFHVRIPAMS